MRTTSGCGFSILFLLGFTSIFGQNQRVADSLKIAYESQLYADQHDTVLFELLKDIAFNENNPDQSILFSELLIDAVEERGKEENTKWLERAYFQKGTALRMKGDYDEAFESLFTTLDLNIKRGSKPAKAATLMGIADTYSEIGNSADAVVYYNQAINEVRQTRDSLTLAIVLLNAGDEYRKSDKLDTALQYFLESALIFNQKDYTIGQAYNMGNIGMVYAKQGRDELAEASFKEANRMLEELGERYALSVYQMEMAQIYLDRGDLDLSLEYGIRSYDIAFEEKLKQQVQDAARIVSMIYEAMDQKGQAYDFLKTYVEYRDSLNSESVIREMSDLRREFEVSQKQLEVDLLNQEKRNQQIIGIGLMLILVMVAIVLITVYRNYQRKRRLNTELELINQTKDRFFSIISHDLRGPISAFYGISRMIRMYIDKKRYGDLEDMTDQIDESVSSISTLLDNLLSWAVQQQGEFPYHPQKMNVRELAETIRHVFRANADAKKINLNIEAPEDLSVWVDRNSTMTIFRNLTGNALKFTEEGGTITLRAKKEEKNALIQVIDTGIGIPDDQVDKIFTLNDQKSTFGTSGEKGLGLGLQLVHEFTTLNKGMIDVESERSKGTTFSVRLPLATRVREVLID